MNSTIEFLDAIKSAYSLTSDGQLAKFLGLTRSGISSYRTGRTYLDDNNAIKVAEVLHIYPALVLAVIHAERTKDEVEKQVWKDLAKRLGGTAAALLLAFAAVPAQDVYADGLDSVSVVCILC